MLFYHVLWTLIGGPLFVGCRFYGHPRLRERMAFERPDVSSNSSRLWVHALSVGEVRSALPLVERIVHEYPGREVIFSSTTTQGLELARKELKDKVRSVVCMPLDFWWSSHRMARWIKPDLFVLVETDLWPGILRYLNRRGTPIVLVNGRISDATFKSYSLAPWLARRLFADITYCLMQSAQDKERLVRIGVPSDKVVSVGNIKFDHPNRSISQRERAHWMEMFGLSSRSTVWVAGSTHGEESKMIVDVFRGLLRVYPDLVLVLAPRRIEEATLLVRLVEQKGLKCLLRTEADGSMKDPQVIVLNTIGELSEIYGIGHVSFVGGSLVPFGGHNLLEPASFGLPVVFGPHTENFAWMAQALEKAQGGHRVKDPEELFSLMLKLIGDKELRARMGEAAQDFVVQNRGALDRVMGYMELCLKGRGQMHHV